MESRNGPAREASRGADDLTLKSAKPVYLVWLQATRPDSESSSIRGLRWILKALGRAHGFKAISIELYRGRP